MKERKYKERFRIVDNDLMRLTGQRAEYTGEYYSYPPDGASARQRALLNGIWVALYWLATLVYLRAGHATSRCMYALVPVLIGLLPGAYAVMGVASTARAPQRMTVVQLEKGPGRLTRAALGCAIFSATGCIGCIVRVTISGLWASAWCEPLLNAVACASSMAAFARGRRDYRALTAK